MKIRLKLFQLMASFCGLFLVSLSGVVSADDSNLTPTTKDSDFIGKAYSLKNDALMYTEFHFVDDGSKTHSVIYKDKDETIIAEKHLKFTAEKTRPEFSQTNALCGEEIVVENDHSDSIDLSYKADFSAAKENKKFKVSDNLVVDAGFNWLVQAHWDALLDGEKIEFDFLAPSQLKHYPLIAKAESCDAFGDVEDGEDTQCFSITPKKWWLKLVLDPIELAYLSDGRKLLGFKGMGNVADDSCKYMEVKIHYQY